MQHQYEFEGFRLLYDLVPAKSRYVDQPSNDRAASGISPMSEPSDLEKRWYWDHRTNKAYYPTEVDKEDGVVELVTAWHHEEVTDALETGALTPVEEVSDPEDGDIGSGVFDSFRFASVEETPEVDND